MQRKDVERIFVRNGCVPMDVLQKLLDRAERAEAEREALQGQLNDLRNGWANSVKAHATLLAERDAAFAAGQEERRVALVYDEAGNVEVYADKGVTIISVCDHTPGDRLYRLNPAPIPDGMLDGHIGHAGDETRADRLATAAAEAIADGVDVLADPGAVFSKVRSN